MTISGYYMGNLLSPRKKNLKKWKSIFWLSLICAVIALFFFVTALIYQYFFCDEEKNHAGENSKEKNVDV